MSTTMAKLELKALTAFQQAIHTSETGEIESQFANKFDSVLWNTQIPCKFKCTQDEDDLIFTTNPTFHYLMYSWLRQKLPSIRVKKDNKHPVQICWCHNVCNNIIISAEARSDDNKFQSFDNFWCDMYPQWYTKPGFKDHFNMCVGNNPILEQWTDFLPSLPVKAVQPWFYSKDTSAAFPIFYCSSQTSIVHRYKMKRKIVDLLRMRIDEGKGWKEIKPNLKYVEGYGTNILPIPQLWGRYAFVTPDEVDYYKTCEGQKERVYYIEDVIACEATNPSVYGSKVDIQLHCDTPCKGVFWVAENLTASNVNNFSNYTTNSSDLFKGWSPIKNYCIMYGSQPRTDIMESDQTEIEPWFHFPSAPWEPGYHVYSYAHSSASVRSDVGVVLSNLGARLLLTISNMDPYSNIEAETEETEDITQDDGESPKIEEQPGKGIEHDPTDVSEDKFMVHVRLLVMKKLVIAQGEEGKFVFREDK